MMDNIKKFPHAELEGETEPIRKPRLPIAWLDLSFGGSEEDALKATLEVPPPITKEQIEQARKASEEKVAKDGADNEKFRARLSALSEKIGSAAQVKVLEHSSKVPRWLSRQTALTLIANGKADLLGWR